MISANELDLTGFRCILAGDHLIPVWRITGCYIGDLDKNRVTLSTRDGEFLLEGIQAIEAIMVLKPSALEGRRLKWSRNAFWFHNLVVHPMLQIMAWAGYRREAVAFHDRHTPRPIS